VMRDNALAGDDGRELHAEARDAADRAANAAGGNAGARTRDRLERYSEALGETPEDIRPGPLILRGEQLRQELERRRNADPDFTDMAPLSDEAMLALEEVVSAHNLMVSVSPRLAGMDEARQGPDNVPPQIDRETAGALIESIGAEGVAAPEALEVLALARDNAPRLPDPNDRRSRLLTETVRNFGRKMTMILTRGFVWGGSVATGGAAAIEAAATHGALAAGGAVVAGVFVLQKPRKLAIDNEANWLKVFTGSPSMQLLIKNLVQALREIPLD